MGYLRLLLAASVVASHATSFDVHLLPGQVAVEAFFLISGFYMSLILDRTYPPREPGNLRRFYANRALRLLPAYWAVLLVAGAAFLLLDVAPFCSPHGVARLAESNPAALTMVTVSNLAVVGQNILFLIGLDPHTGQLGYAPHAPCAGAAWRFLLVPQAWSLALELGFYALVPLLARLRTRSLAVILLASLTLRITQYAASGGADLLGRRTLPFELWLFVAGMLAERAHRVLGRVIQRSPRLTPHVGPAAIVAGVALTILALAYERWQVVMPVFLALTCVSLPILFAATRTSRLDRLLGGFSYPLYLSHYTVLVLFEELLPDAPLPLVFCTVLVAAWALWALVERPLERVRSRVHPASAAAPDHTPAAHASDLQFSPPWTSPALPALEPAKADH